jgi:hypothetical protein
VLAGGVGVVLVLLVLVRNKRGKAHIQQTPEPVYDEVVDKESIQLETNTCYEHSIKLNTNACYEHIKLETNAAYGHVPI